MSKFKFGENIVFENAKVPGVFIRTSVWNKKISPITDRSVSNVFEP